MRVYNFSASSSQNCKKLNSSNHLSNYLKYVYDVKGQLTLLYIYIYILQVATNTSYQNKRRLHASCMRYLKIILIKIGICHTHHVTHLFFELKLSVEDTISKHDFNFKIMSLTHNFCLKNECIIMCFYNNFYPF